MKQENYIKGMVMIILSAFFFACMNVSVRLAGDLPSVQKSFFRNLVAAVFAAIILTRKHMVPRVQKQYWGSLFLRCAFGTLGILCNFYAIDHLLVADASILNKLSPFFAIIFSFLAFEREDYADSGSLCISCFYRMFVCCETGVPECGIGSGTDRCLWWAWSRGCLYNGACARDTWSERPHHSVLFFCVFMPVCVAVSDF